MQINNNKAGNLSFKSDYGHMIMISEMDRKLPYFIAEHNRKIKKDMQLHPENYRRISPKEKQEEINKNKTEAAIVLGLTAAAFAAWRCLAKKINPFKK